MNLVLVLMVGALCGALAGLLLPAARSGAFAANAGVGAGGAFLTGALSGPEGLLGGLDAVHLAIAALGALLLLGLINLPRLRSGQRAD